MVYQNSCILPVFVSSEEEKTLYGFQKFIKIIFKNMKQITIYIGNNYIIYFFVMYLLCIYVSMFARDLLLRT
jgi:hypothetical protein